MERYFILRTFTDDEAETCKRCNMQELIRCKDCKHWDEETAQTNTDFGLRTAVCILLKDIDTWGEYPESCFRTEGNWFCADGERKTAT